MPVLVRNLVKGPSVFSYADTKNGIEWQAAGDPSGQDVQFVTEEMVMNPSFLRAIHRGLFEVIDPTDELRVMLDKQTAFFAQYRPDPDQDLGPGPSVEDRRTLVNMEITDGRITGIARPTDKLDADGKPVEVTIPVIIDPNTSKVFTQH